MAVLLRLATLPWTVLLGMANGVAVLLWVTIVAGKCHAHKGHGSIT